MKIFLITSSRADFGILRNLINELKKNKKFDLKVITTGSHFLKKHGNSFTEILKNRIKIFKKIKIRSRNLKVQDIISDMCVILKKISKLIFNNKPNLLIVLGDRYEIFASALPFYFYRIPIAHIQGGEVTQGSLDDGIRHCLTKISSIHFVANQIYKKRVIQLGENPKSVFNVGGLGVENIYKTKLLDQNELEKKLNIKFKKKSLIINFQPELNKQLTKKLLTETLKALESHKDKTLIFTMPGADLNKYIIFDLVKKFKRKNKNAFIFKSLGSLKFLSCLKIVDGMVGNSSSGITEMPTFKKATVNIGNRQLGRLLAPSVINVKPESQSIALALNKIYSLKFRKRLNNISNPYGNGQSTKKIITILKKLKLEKINNKIFYDIKN